MQDDGTCMLVMDRGAQRGPDRVAADLSSHRSAPRAPGHDGTTHLDKGDVAPAARRQMRAALGVPPIREEQHGIAIGTDPRTHRCIRLVAVAQGVNQSDLQRLRRGAWPGVGKLLDADAFDLAPFGDRDDCLGEYRLGKTVERHAVSLG